MDSLTDPLIQIAYDAADPAPELAEILAAGIVAFLRARPGAGLTRRPVPILTVPTASEPSGAPSEGDSR